jgi:hypothetical protein
MGSLPVLFPVSEFMMSLFSCPAVSWIVADFWLGYFVHSPVSVHPLTERRRAFPAGCLFVESQDSELSSLVIQKV